MRILLIGTWESNAGILARQLSYYGIDVDVVPNKFLNRLANPKHIITHDLVYVPHLYSGQYDILLAKTLMKKCIIHFVGGDAFRFVKRRRSLRSIKEEMALRIVDKILYCSNELKQAVGLKGETLPIPIDTKIFRPPSASIAEEDKRDILYYCPDFGRGIITYRLNWILNYAREYPDETITILRHKKQFPQKNIHTISYVPYELMPTIYYRHKKLIRMTTHEGHPKMPYEALLCGLEVVWNGQRITKVPALMLMENTIPKLISILKELVRGRIRR